MKERTNGQERQTKGEKGLKIRQGIREGNAEARKHRDTGRRSKDRRKRGK